MTLHYANVDSIYESEPRLRGVTGLTSAQAFLFAQNVEAVIHGKIVKQYTVPVDDYVPLLEAIANDMTVYRIMSRRVGFTPRTEGHNSAPNPWKENMALLDQIADGSVALTNSAGALITARDDVGEARSTTDGYLPTFTELDEVNWSRDPEKVQDLLDEREL